MTLRGGMAQEASSPLCRAAGFAQDLEYYLGPDWRAQCPKSPAVREYEVSQRLVVSLHTPMLPCFHVGQYSHSHHLDASHECLT